VEPLKEHFAEKYFPLREKVKAGKPRAGTLKPQSVIESGDITFLQT
jgi:hypothetical protein